MQASCPAREAGASHEHTSERVLWDLTAVWFICVQQDAASLAGHLAWVDIKWLCTLRAIGMVSDGCCMAAILRPASAHGALALRVTSARGPEVSESGTSLASDSKSRAVAIGFARQLAFKQGIHVHSLPKGCVQSTWHSFAFYSARVIIVTGSIYTLCHSFALPASLR
jgi:hypothetical protein